MALPRTGTLGQKVDYQGYVYQWTGVGWNNIGQSLLVVANTNIFANNNFTMGNSTVNTLITSAIITTGGATTNSSITIDAISVANSIMSTVINPRGVFTGNSTTNVVITANTFTVGNTSLTSDGVITGNSTANSVLGSNSITVANSTGSTIITPGSVTTNSLVVSAGFSIGNSTSNNRLSYNRIIIGNNSVNLSVNSTTINIGSESINSSVYTGTANNAKFLGYIAATNYINTTDNYNNISGNLIFTSNVSFSANVSFFGSQIYYDNGLKKSYYTGTAFNALNADTLGNYGIEDFEFKVDLPADVALLKSACSAFSDNAAKLGGVLPANYIQTTGNYTVSGIHTYTANLEIRNANLVINTNATIWASGSKGTLGQILVATGSTVRWDDASAVVDQNATYNWTNVHSFSNSITFSKTILGTANNSLYLGGVIASSYALKTYSDSEAATAYSNAVARIAVAYSNAMADTLSRSGTYTGNNLFQGTNTVFSSNVTVSSANLNFTGTRFTINSGSQAVGNSTVNTFINSTSIAVTNSTTNVSVYSNKIVVGNTTVNLSINSSSVAIGTGIINATSFTGESNSAVYFGGATSAAYVNTTGSFTLGGNVSFNSNVYINKLYANNDIGLGGQVLVTSGPGGNIFWQTVGGDGGVIGSVTRVSTGNGMIGGPIVGFGTVSVLANSGIIANATGVYTNNTYLSTVFAPLSGAAFTGDVSVSGNLSVTGNLSITGNSVSIGANSLVVKDAVISLHTTADLAPLTSNDGRLIGTAYHYYLGGDKQALLAMNQTNAFLTYYSTSTDAASGDPTGTTLGTIQANTFYAGNSTVYATINATTYTGAANNASYLGGVAASGYVNTSGSYTFTGVHTFKANIAVNSAIIAGGTSGTLGQVLTSNGTSNVYWATITDIFGGAVTSITGGDGLNGGTITSTGTLSVKYSNGIIVDTNGVRVRPGTDNTTGASNSVVANSSGLYVNTTWLSNQGANNAYFLVGVDGNKFVQNTDSRTLSGNLIFAGTNTIFNSNVALNHFVSGNIIPGSNSTQYIGNSSLRMHSIYISNVGGIYIGNTFLQDDNATGTGYLVVNGAIINTISSNSLSSNSATINTLTLTNALLPNSGGTGLHMYAAGDMIYATDADTFTTVSIPIGTGAVANGKILQLINNLPAWGDIDCGTF
jgi:hypothetical protein